MNPKAGLLEGKKGLVVGIANADSIAYGAARAMHAAGAELAITYLNDRAEPYVRPLADELGSTIVLPLDVERPGQLDHLFDEITTKWGKLDFLLHAIAFAPASDLHGRVVDSSLEGFQQAMRVSCYSLIEMTRRAEPLMQHGGAVLTMSFYGADKVVGEYNMMGPVKAALQATVRYLSRELGPNGIRVHAVSAGPIRTRAAGGLAKFDELLADAESQSPLGRLVTIDEVGHLATYLVSDWATGLTGDTIFVDGGRHIVS